jgi:hypothetical protein
MQPPPPPTPDEIYSKIWVKIEKQIGQAVSTLQVAVDEGQFDTLKQNIADIVLVLASRTGLANNDVIEQLESIDSIMTLNTLWYQIPGASDKFMLCGPVGGKSTEWYII